MESGSETTTRKGFEPSEEQMQLISKHLNNESTLVDPDYNSTHFCLSEK